MSQLRVIAKGKEEFKPKCNVFSGKGVDTYTDFITVGYDESTGRATLHMNADVMTVGQAIQMLSVEFKSMYDSLSPEQKKDVDSILRV